MMPFRRGRSGQSGFVLPVAILIVLVLSLVTVGLLNRSTQRNFQTQVERAGQVVTGQVNTAIDRARAKIDFLINDPRLPRSTPSDAQLTAALINADIPDTDPAFLLPFNPDQPYVLPGESQFLIDTDFQVPNPNFVDPIITPTEPEDLPVPIQSPAWWFNVDTDGDGNDDAVTVYAILTNRNSPNDLDPSTAPNRQPVIPYEDNRLTDEERASRLMIRGGPLQGASLEGCVDVATGTGTGPDTGDWFQVGSKLFKPFQVYAVTIPTDGASATTRALSALQFQQDRQRSVLNKWGAFSRTDIEFIPTPTYNWNGAMYSGGSLFFRYLPPPRGDDLSFRAYLISSEGSCFYLPVENSEIKAFGELVSGEIGFAAQQNVQDKILFDGHPGERNTSPSLPVTRMNSAAASSVVGVIQPQEIALDPLDLLLTGDARPRGAITRNPTWGQSELNIENPVPGSERAQRRIEAGQFRGTPFAENISPSGDPEDPSDRQLCPPYVDDTFRADNRFGPKPSYERPPITPSLRDADGDGNLDGCGVNTFRDVYGAGAVAGANIAAVAGPDPRNSDLSGREPLIQDNPPPGDLPNVGLDGYWERRARREGLRVIVGQRLELTSADSIPLPLGNGNQADPRTLQRTLITNQARQRLTLRDKPAAVQAAAVYHYSENNGNFPVACLAMVAHPGSAESLRRASSFPTTPTDGINFFTGTGTNVWEFETPSEADFRNNGSNLMVALRNLAFFAGDPDGAYPPLQEPGQIHPDPYLTTFGDFSNLRRLFNTSGLVTGYDNLSLADRTTLHTAGCALGMLAWNIQELATSTDPATVALVTNIVDSVNGDADNSILTADVQAGRVVGFEGLLDNPGNNRLYLPLWYIFPEQAHRDRDPSVGGLPPDVGSTLIRRRFSANVNTAYDYAPVTLATVAITPRNNINNWILPHTQQNCESATAGPNSNRFDFIRIGNQCHRVPFKDSVLYDGREAMAVRVMNVDLSLLVDQARNAAGATLTVSNNRINGDTWLPDGAVEGNGIAISDGGIFYAVREDAVREDGIARPRLTDFANFQTRWRAPNANGRASGDLGDLRIMNAGQPGRTVIGDPPVEPTTELSPKAVDYFPDPDRRPYGFRLKNGDILRRGGFVADESVFGLSFITDNPVYIQGNFNLHQDNAGNELEEFDNTVTFNGDGTYNVFYGRPRANENRDFARAAVDNWRPTDVVADSVNILSRNYCDGSIDDGFLQDGTLNGGGNQYDSNRNFTGGRTSAPQREVNYGCSFFDENGVAAALPLGNTSFINQALVLRGNNWPARNLAEPNADPNSGVRQFGANGSQDLGNITDRPGQAELFSRETPVVNLQGFTSPDVDPVIGSRVPLIRDLRAPDGDYVAYPTRISALGNPVIDTTRWLTIADPQPCPRPNGNGLLAEYYNGWRTTAELFTTAASRYRPETGFDSTANPAVNSLATDAFTNNLPYLRAVRSPDSPAFSSATLFDYNWSGGAPFQNNLTGTRTVGGIPIQNGLPSCSNPIAPGDNAIDIPNILEGTPASNNPLALNRFDIGNFFFRRSCWQRFDNNNGSDFYVGRWVGQLFPERAGPVDYILATDDGNRLVIRNNPDYDGGGSFTTLATPLVGTNWVANVRTTTLTADLECSPRTDQSPYLIEMQFAENGGNAFSRFRSRALDGSTPNFPLRNLMPINSPNIPCQADPGIAPLPNQAYCVAECIDIVQNSTLPACPGAPNNCGQVLNGVESGVTRCPGIPDVPFARPVTRTCNETRISNTFTTYVPSCAAAQLSDRNAILSNGNARITQAREQTEVFSCNNRTVVTPQTRNATCTCNYSFNDPLCANDPRSQQCGNGFTITQNVTGNLSGGNPNICPATRTESRTVSCNQERCGGGTLPRDMRPDSPLTEPGLQASSEHPSWIPSPTKLLGATFNWFFGQPAYAAQRGVPSDLLPATVSDPRRAPGIVPAIAPGVFDAGQDYSAVDGFESRRVFMRCPNDLDGPDPTSGGFYVPGLFRPNFNTTFGYTAYNGDSVPSTLRFEYSADVPAAGANCQLDQDPRDGVFDALSGRIGPIDVNGDGTLNAAERRNAKCEYVAGETVQDRDPLFGFDADVDGDGSLLTRGVGDIQPQMYLNPYARVVNNATQGYNPDVTNANHLYRDGYYIDDQEQNGIRNGLCFYARLNTGNIEMFIDRNGSRPGVSSGGNNVADADALAWVAVESISRDNGSPSTGFAGANPLLGIVLDERSRRPIPIPSFEQLRFVDVANPATEANRRRRDNNGGNFQLIPATETQVNTIAVSGTIPSRLNQPNGGLPNFVRLNELWRNGGQNVALFFRGSMIELNYSNTATAPWFQFGNAITSSFEPPNYPPVITQETEQSYDYYFQPLRRYGYDVALQIARSISPVSARFEFPDQAVSEFIRDVPPQDPYVRRLRCALQEFIDDNPGTLVLDRSAQLDPAIDCASFPAP